MIKPIFLTALSLAAAGGIYQYSQLRDPVVHCAQSEGSGQLNKTLIVGESWAAGKRLSPEMRQSISKRIDRRPVKICAVAFSGFNTAQQVSGIQKLGLHKITEILGGKPDQILIVTGINDIAQRMGSTSYKENVAKLSDALSPLSENQSILELPAINPQPEIATHRALKRFVFSIFDGDDEDRLILKYRSALDAPGLHVINYDEFANPWPSDVYTNDGIHLTDQEFHRLGGYLGQKLRIR